MPLGIDVIYSIVAVALVILVIVASSYYLASVRDIFLTRFAENIERSRQSIVISGIAAENTLLLELYNPGGSVTRIDSISAQVEVGGSIVVVSSYGASISSGEKIYRVIRIPDGGVVRGVLITASGSTYIYPVSPLPNAIVISKNMGGSITSIAVGNNIIDIYVLEHYECYAGSRTTQSRIDKVRYVIGYQGNILANDSISYGSTDIDLKINASYSGAREHVECIAASGFDGYLVAGRGVAIISSGDLKPRNIVFGSGVMDRDHLTTVGCERTYITNIAMPIWHTGGLNDISWARHLWYILSSATRYDYPAPDVLIPASTAYSNALIIATLVICKVSQGAQYASIIADFPATYPIFITI